MTFIKAVNERLILVASASRFPWAPDFFYHSLPARSTRFNFPTVIFGSTPTISSYVSTKIENIQCDLEE